MTSKNNPKKMKLHSVDSSEPVKYVRVRSDKNARFVEFDFAIGDPSIFVELLLPPKAFEIFCLRNDVVFMTDAQAKAVDEEMVKWRYGEEAFLKKGSKSSS